MQTNKKKTIVRKKVKVQRRREPFGIPRNLQPQRVMPPKKVVTLDFLDPVCQIAGANTFLIKSLRVNDPYDPDPAPFTTGYTAFEHLMLFYFFYHAKSIRVDWNPANQETSFPVLVGIKFSQTNLSSTILTRQTAIDAMENGIASELYTLQRNTGGPSNKRIVRSINLAALFGNKSLYNGSPDFVGTATSSPTDQLWCNFIVIAPTTITNLPNGVIGALQMQMRLELFGAQTLDDSVLDKKAIDTVLRFSPEKFQQLIAMRNAKKF